MTLTTHSIIAAAVTKPIAHLHPALIFLVAIASHYLSDAIPHWDYPLRSIAHEKDADRREWSHNPRVLLGDIAKFSFDGLLGAAIVILLARPSSSAEWLWIASAILGGSLPDFLQGLYMLKARFLKPHQRLHDVMHTAIRLGSYPRIGIPFQFAVALLAAWFL